MEEKFFLSEEDVKNLSRLEQESYNRFLSRVESGYIYDEDLKEFDEILHRQYRLGVFNDKNGRRPAYFEIIAENINKFLDQIIKIRNNGVKGSFKDSFNFEKINDSLNALKRFVMARLQGYSDWLGINHLRDDVLPRIEQLESQLLKDKSFYVGYINEKNSVIGDYMWKKNEYDRLSLFGKFAARINGKKKELTEAHRKMMSYKVESIQSGQQQQHIDIYNSPAYDRYLESQLPEQSTGGMRR